MEGQPSTGTRYAGFLPRLVAVIVDGVILGVVNFVLRAVFGDVGADPTVGVTVEPASGLGAVISLAYFTIMEGGPWQATVGKRVLGLRVTDTNGEPIGYGKALVRNLAKIVSGAILLIGYIMAAFTTRKQALHDMIAGTLVVKR